jgi:hypothetical protein
MEVKLKKEKVNMVLSQINLLLGKDNKIKLNYALIRNKEKLESAAKKIKKDIDVFEKERIDCCEKYCEKDDKGKAILKDKHYQGLEPGNNDEFDKEYKIIREKAENYLSEEITIEGYKILKSFLPEVMNGLQQEAILPFVHDDSGDIHIKN